MFVCVCVSDNEQLARSGSNCLENLIISNGSTFSVETWQSTCNCVVQIFRDTQPSQLLVWRPDPDPTQTQENTVSHVITHGMIGVTGADTGVLSTTYTNTNDADRTVFLDLRCYHPVGAWEPLNTTRKVYADRTGTLYAAETSQAL